MENSEEGINKEGESNSKKKSIIVIVLMILGGLAFCAMIVLAVLKVVKQKPDWFGLSSSNLNQAETESLINDVGKIIELPDEIPTIATVTESERLSGQKFFEKAENGDKVLVFANAKKAILYRPSVNKVIEVGVVNLNQQPVVEGNNEGTSSNISPLPSTTLKPKITATPTPIPSPTPIDTL